MNSKLLALLILLASVTLAFFSLKNDSAIMDEISHLPAGYSYVTKQDMRINPEHPPLLKDLAGLSVLAWSKVSGEEIKFPNGDKAWEEDINGQWDFGFHFMYDLGNNADSMLLWGRLPFLLIMLLLGFFVFRWTRELYGDKAALIATLLYAFSPTVLAHSRFVTTDLGAAAAFFISLYYFTHWLKAPNFKNTLKAGLVFGLALLAKFSTFLLIPLFIFLAAVYAVLLGWRSGKLKAVFGNLFSYGWKLLALGLIGVVFVVIPVYQFHVQNYTPEMQRRDVNHILNNYPISFVPDLVHWTIDKPVLRAFGQYLFGLAMVFQRATGGNTTYFLGEISTQGWHHYFPVVYLLKETLALHLLTLLALYAFFSRCFKNCKNYHSKQLDCPPEQPDCNSELPNYHPKQTDCHLEQANCHPELVSGSRQRLLASRLPSWLIKVFPQFAMLSFLALYWLSSITSNLNIGVRHVLPTFPFIFLLVAGQISLWILPCNPQKWFCGIRGLTFKASIVVALLLWGVFSVISVYPSFLAYFNEAAGGADGGHRYAVDSNLDWGQDVKRLKLWADENGVDKIYLDYFGGTSPNYYFGDRALEWHGHFRQEQMTESQYLAVSLTFLRNDLGRPAPDFQEKNGFYQWLEDKTPVAKIGHSIWVYKIEN